MMKTLVNKCFAMLLLWPCFGNAQHLPESTVQTVFMTAFDYYFLHEFCASQEPEFSAASLQHNMQEDIRQVLRLSQSEAVRYVEDFVSSYTELVSDNEGYGAAVSFRLEQFNAINNDTKWDICISLQQERRQQLQEALKLLKSE